MKKRGYIIVNTRLLGALVFTAFLLGICVEFLYAIYINRPRGRGISPGLFVNMLGSYITILLYWRIFCRRLAERCPAYAQEISAASRNRNWDDWPWNKQWRKLWKKAENEPKIDLDALIQACIKDDAEAKRIEREWITLQRWCSFVPISWLLHFPLVLFFAGWLESVVK